MERKRSPRYPAIPLGEAVTMAKRIHDKDGTHVIEREAAVRHMGYTTLNGASATVLGALGHYGLLEGAGKNQVRLTPRALDVFLPQEPADRTRALLDAANEPRIFNDLRERFPDRVPSEDTLKAYLVREGFTARALSALAAAYVQTHDYVDAEREDESHGHESDGEGESAVSDMGTGGAVVGDVVQWHTGGAPQFETPRRVRWVSDDRGLAAVEGSDKGLPMTELSVMPPAATHAQTPPPEVSPAKVKSTEGFSEWFRAKVGSDKIVTINFKGEGEIGPREIEKMIKILTAQKEALTDDD